MLFLDPKVRDLDVAELMKLFFGDGLELEVIKDNRWYFNFFVARMWRRGAFFIAGDASHQWPPIGGLNGNNGIMSAYNLAWKLAAVLEGWGGPRVLDSYEAERRGTTLRRAYWVLGIVPRPWLIYRCIKIANMLPFFWPMMLAKWYFGNACPSNGNHNCQPGLLSGNRCATGATRQAATL